MKTPRRDFIVKAAVFKTALVFLCAALFVQPCRATIDDALSYALEAADPYVKEGFTVREDYWGGDLPVKQQKAIVHQLFKGNEYWFWMGTDDKGAKISVHIYDSQGNIAEVEKWQKPHFAAARVIPKSTGTYYLIVEIEKAAQERTHWALAYGFR
jgi:hypothetical protein